MTNEFEFRQSIRRRAIVMEIGGSRPPEDPKASWFGQVLFAAENEGWPLTSEGTPMTPLAQINLGQLSFRPPRLDDLEFLTIFIDPDRLADSDPYWCVRGYPDANKLTPLGVPPDLSSHIRPFAMFPKVIEEDFPCHEDLPMEIPEELENADFDNTPGFKLGGWPSLIQSEIFWAPFNRDPANPEYVFQIDSASKAGWAWGDSGVGYFGRGTAPGYENEWRLQWQCA